MSKAGLSVWNEVRDDVKSRYKSDLKRYPRSAGDGSALINGIVREGACLLLTQSVAEQVANLLRQDLYPLWYFSKLLYKFWQS
jgi:hypothetical protein